MKKKEKNEESDLKKIPDVVCFFKRSAAGNVR